MSSPVSVEEISKRHGVLRRSGAVGGSALLAGGAVGSAVLLSLFASPAGAVTTYTVDTNADGVANASDCVTPVANSCSLRDALDAATTDGDVIVFAAPLSGQTISLSQGQLRIEAGITITGLGSANLTVDAASNSRVFYISASLTPGVEVVISGLSIISGDASGEAESRGGGVYDDHRGHLTLNDVSITGNEAKYGGGVYKGREGDLTLNDVSITGNEAFDGGGVYKRSDGNLEIVDSTFGDNYASSAGGALLSHGVGDLVITNSTFDGNTAVYAGGAGKIENDGNVTITGSTFSENTSLQDTGGALYLNGVTGDVSVSGSTFSDNTATYDGGAIKSQLYGSFTVTSSTFSDNTAAYGGGAIKASGDGSFTVTSSTFSDNTAAYDGGAIKAENDGSFTVTSSTFSGNTAAYGGGAIYARGGVMTINNSTFVGNTSDSDGGAIFKWGVEALTINMSTITGNSAGGSGGGVWFYAYGDSQQPDVTITGTILTGNRKTDSVFNPNDLWVDARATTVVVTISDSILGVVDADIIATASNNIDATAPGFVLGLAALADNGGATETMALLTGSPAIDAGPATVPTFTGNGFDQRGTPHVRVYNGQSDIGAFELQPDPTPATTTTTGAVTTTTVSSDEPVVPTFTG